MLHKNNKYGNALEELLHVGRYRICQNVIRLCNKFASLFSEGVTLVITWFLRRIGCFIKIYSVF